MVFTRRGRRTLRRGSSKARKTYWLGQQESFDEFQLVTSTPAGGYGLTASWWTVWPSSTFDPVLQDFTAADRTLVRTILNANLGVNLGGIVPGVLSPPVVWVLGLIAWSANDPGDYDQQTWTGTSPGKPPHPCLDADDDWIIRLPFCFTVDQTYQGPAVEPFIMSRAMRKLPPEMGVLGVVGGFSTDPNGSTNTLQLIADFRHAIKQGYNR